MYRWTIGLGLLFSATVLAGSMGPLGNNPREQGLYLGADIGLASFMDDEFTPYAQNLYDKHKFSSSGILGGGLLGYDFCFGERYALGFEGFLNATALNIAAEQLYGAIPSYNAKMRYNTGVRVLPAYEFVEGTTGHILLGYAYGNFNIKDNGNYGYIQRELACNGFQVGLGLNFNPGFSVPLSLRADMIYTNYASSNVVGLSPTFAPQNYHNQFASLEGNLALIYKFLNG